MNYTIEKSNESDYNKIIQLVNNYSIGEKDYLYGHDKRFIRLRRDIKKEAHRVISPAALKFAGIEEIYNVTDINGNTYTFEIFHDSNYRVIEVVKLKEQVKEAIHETNLNKNS